MGKFDNLNDSQVPDILRRLGRLERASPMNNAAVGRGGFEVYDGGVITISNGGLNVTGTASVLGTLIASGIINFTGTVTISGPLTVSGLTTVTNNLVVASGGKITAGTIELNPDGSAKFGTMTISPAGKITSGSAEINPDGSVKFGTFLIDTAGKVTVANDMTVTTGGKIKVGTEMTLTPATAGGSVVFTNGSLEGTPNGSQLKSATGGNYAYVSSSQAGITSGTNAVFVSSAGATVTGGFAVSGNSTFASGMTINSWLSTTGSVTFAGTTTTTGTANLLMNGSGQIFKVSSAARFKVDPQPMDLPDSLLDVRVKDWWDAGEVERGEQKYRIPGVIAEEVEAAGGERFVTYGDDGEIQSVAYDRYALARTEILARRLDEAEGRIEELSRMVNALLEAAA